MNFRDIDVLALVGSKEQKQTISDREWAWIGSILQDIHLVRNGLAAENFVQKLELQLKENCDSDATIDLLKSIPWPEVR